MPQKIFILMRNDYPERAYVNEAEAQREQEKAQQAADKEIHLGDMRAYWHLHDVPLIGGEGE